MHREQPPQSWPFLSLGSAEALREPVDLSELLLEIRHLRLQLERSIQTNTALRERLEEQLLRGHKHSETININYLLSSMGKDTALTPAGHIAPLGRNKRRSCGKESLWRLKLLLLSPLCQMKAAGHQDVKTAIVSPSRVRKMFAPHGSV